MLKFKRKFRRQRVNGPPSGPQELRSMQIHVAFMEVLQLDGIPSVLQFEIKLYITIKSHCIKLLTRQQNSIRSCILKIGILKIGT